MNRIIFLGSGGGRGMIRTQERSTAGIYVELGGGPTSETSNSVKFCIDPGPGTLVRAIAAKLQPEKWNGILVSHMHIDQSADANSLLDAMSHNGIQPFLVAERHCVEPKGKNEKINDYFPCITTYHQNRSKVYSMEPGKKIKLNGMEISAVLADHYDPTVGFVIKTNNFTVGCASDGAYYKGIEKHYSGCDLLIISTAIPANMEAKPHFHMGVKDVVAMLRDMKEKPKLVVLDRLTPFIIRANIWKQTKIIQDATKVKTISSEDGMEINLENFSQKILAIR